MTPRLNVTVSKTTDGLQEYMQIINQDLTVNIVLIADKIVIHDARPIKRAPSKTS